MSTEPRPLPATYAAVIFKGDNLLPELVTAIMEQQPTLAYERGDTYQIRDIEHQRQFGLWIYSTRNKVHSTSLKKHLAALETLILGEHSGWPDSRWAKIRDLLKSQPIEFRVDVFWYGAEGAPLPEISQSFRWMIESAGGWVETDFHRDGDKVEAA